MQSLRLAIYSRTRNSESFSLPLSLVLAPASRRVPPPLVEEASFRFHCEISFALPTLRATLFSGNPLAPPPQQWRHLPRDRGSRRLPPPSLRGPPLRSERASSRRLPRRPGFLSVGVPGTGGRLFWRGRRLAFRLCLYPCPLPPPLPFPPLLRLLLLLPLPLCPPPPSSHLLPGPHPSTTFSGSPSSPKPPPSSPPTPPPPRSPTHPAGTPTTSPSPSPLPSPSSAPSSPPTVPPPPPPPSPVGLLSSSPSSAPSHHLSTSPLPRLSPEALRCF